jgi:hypothetical protein
MRVRISIVVFLAALLGAPFAAAQDVTKLVTRADVEKASGQKFKDGWKPSTDSILFQQEPGDLQVGVDIEKRDPGASVRGWEATMKKLQATAKVETLKGVGVDAIVYSTRPDSAAVSADFDNPRVQMRVSVLGAKNVEQAKKIVVDLAKTVGPRVGK